MVKDKLELTETEYDALRECGNVGIGNAATALSNLLNKRVDINIPETKFVPLQDFAKELDGPESIVSGIYLDIGGDLSGEALFVFPEDSAKKLSATMLGKKVEEIERIGEMEESAIKEMSNVVIGAYLNSLADMLNMKVTPSPPHTATDMAQALIDFVLAKLSKHSDEILLVREEIGVEEQGIDGVVVIVFDVPSLKKLLKSLHDNYGVRTQYR
ncbi:MAG: chemotaxis protein CheC [Nanoarchaeota archaeon]